jgi:hypothetical protein
MILNRRTFLHTTLLGAAGVVARADERLKAPFRALYSSDTTHILTCTSPWHQRGEKLTASMFQASVDEAADAGADAYLLQPGMGWVPWWPSKVLPLDQHAAWFREHFASKKTNPYFDFLLAGGDLVKLSVDRCRERNIGAFVSFRLNDAHHKEEADDPKRTRVECVSQFYAEHLEYRLGPQPEQTSYAAKLHNWAIPEVREFKFRFIEELCRNYDLDGFELDFMRHPHYFRLGETTREQRRAIMVEFIARVRRVLDETARGRRHRWLSVRIPAHLASHDNLGVDVAAFAAAGVEMFDLSTYYHTEQRTSLGAIRKLAPNAAIYHELTQCTAFNKKPQALSHRRSTPEQLTTTANLAYARGADGIALFNFQYYRAQSHEPDPPTMEPPFAVVKTLRDRKQVSTLPQHYFIGVNYSEPRPPKRPLPRPVKDGTKTSFTLDLAPLAGGWKNDGRLRIQSELPLGESKWTATLNGNTLSANPDVTEPYPNPFTQLLGTAETLRAWNVPLSTLRDGDNTLDVVMTGAPEAIIIFLDLALA